jgi:AmiR/NasT family two-component response regulator
VATSLALARAQFLYERRLRSRIDKLDETLRAFRSVERAKTILMQTRKLDEEEAYHFMRRQAMSRRISITAVAAAIVDSNELLG